MTGFHVEAEQILHRCRRIGWRVEQSKTKSAKWLYRITSPDDNVIEIPKSPANGWVEHVLLELTVAGFEEAERDWMLRDQAEREQPAPTAPTLALADAVFSEPQRNGTPAKAGKPMSPLIQKYMGGIQPVDIGWMLRPSIVAETRMVLVTPEAAKRALEERNTRNRPLSSKRVAFFEDEITNGRMRLTHQGASFDVEGYLQDGQTRFQAIVNTNTAVPMLVTVGMPVENFPLLDIGTKRNAGDVAYIMGEHTDYKTIASTVKTLISVHEFGDDAHIRDRSWRISNDRLGRALPEYSEAVRAALQEAKEIRREVRRANVVGLCAALYLLQRRLPENYALLSQFLEDVKYADMVPSDSPAHRVREALQNGNAQGKPYGRWETAALLLKAWNKYATGERIRGRMVWKVNEGFPSTVFLPPPTERQQPEAEDDR